MMFPSYDTLTVQNFDLDVALFADAQNSEDLIDYSSLIPPSPATAQMIPPLSTIPSPAPADLFMPTSGRNSVSSPLSNSSSSTPASPSTPQSPPQQSPSSAQSPTDSANPCNMAVQSVPSNQGGLSCAPPELKYPSYSIN